jgi:hypothetical protein
LEDVVAVKINCDSARVELAHAYLYGGFPKIENFRKLVKRGQMIVFCFCLDLMISRGHAVE